MTVLLALDTSADTATAALLSDKGVSSDFSEGFSSHSLTALPMTARLLKEAGLSTEDVTGVAFGSGPGSFTGIRTACGIMQGIAFSRNLKAVCVPTLYAVARRCHRLHGETDCLAVIDARMGEVYYARYRLTGDGWETVVPPSLAPAADVPVGDAPALCGNGLSAYEKEFTAIARTARRYAGIISHAEDIALIAKEEFDAGRAVSAEEMAPLYIRDRVAKTIAEREGS